MNRTFARISGVLAITCAAAAALWIWRQSPESDGTPGPLPAASLPQNSGQATQSAPDGAKSADTRPSVPTAMRDADAKPAESLASGTLRARKPTLGLPENAKTKDLHELSEAELERYGPQVETYRKAAERYLGPLLYPPGDPREGTYRDNVSLEDAVDAQLRYQEEVNPPGYLDKPWLHVEKSIPFADVNRRQQTWDQSDLASTRAFYDWLKEQPDVPGASRGDFWLPADPSDPERTTRREYMSERIRRHEAPFFTDQDR